VIDFASNRHCAVAPTAGVSGFSTHARHVLAIELVSFGETVCCSDDSLDH
jgi:hypothetical protein